MQLTSSATLVDHTLCYLIFNISRTGCRIHEDIDALASVIFGLMAQSTLLVSTRSIHNWISFSVCQLSILTPFNTNFMIIFTQLLTATLIVTGTCTTPTRAPFYRLYFLQSTKRVLHVTLPYNWRPSSMVENLRGEKFPRYQLPVHLSSQRLPKCISY